MITYLALVLLEESGNTGLIDGQRLGFLSGDMADQQFTTVSNINGGDGVEKGVQFHDRLLSGGTLSTGKFGQNEAFGSQGQSSEGGDGDGNLGSGQDIGGGTGHDGDGVESGDGSQGTGSSEKCDLVHFQVF